MHTKQNVLCAEYFFSFGRDPLCGPREVFKRNMIFWNLNVNLKQLPNQRVDQRQERFFLGRRSPQWNPPGSLSLGHLIRRVWIKTINNSLHMEINWHFYECWLIKGRGILVSQSHLGAIHSVWEMAERSREDKLLRTWAVTSWGQISPWAQHLHSLSSSYAA